MKFPFILLVLLTTPVWSRAQSFYDKEYDELAGEFRKVVVHVDRKKVESFTASYTMDAGKKARKGKIRITFLNDSVFEMKDHQGKEKFVFRGNNFFSYDEKNPLVLSGIRHTDSADCVVYWGEPALSDSSLVSYARFQKDSLGRTIDYYFTFNKSVVHETYVYEGDTAYFHNCWRTYGDSLRHVYCNYVYEYYTPDSSFYTKLVKHYPFPDDSGSGLNNTYGSTRIYITRDASNRVSEVRMETADATNGREAIGVYLHRMRFSYKLR